jgi:hypothetical protein
MNEPFIRWPDDIQQHGRNGIKVLYKHAAFLSNPSFLGWAFEADLIDRYKSGHLEFKTRGAGIWSLRHRRYLQLRLIMMISEEIIPMNKDAMNG